MTTSLGNRSRLVSPHPSSSQICVFLSTGTLFLTVLSENSFHFQCLAMSIYSFPSPSNEKSFILHHQCAFAHFSKVSYPYITYSALSLPNPTALCTLINY